MNDVKSVAEINQYVGTSVNPLETPDTVYELYSVPSFDGQYPEIIKGANIGSTKVTVEAGDVLVCKINPRINRVWVVKHHTEHQLLASSEWIVIRNHDIDSDYLKWYFSSPTFRELLTSQVAGIGGSLTRAQPKQVAKYPVPVPAISVQRHIATVLNKVNDLIILRKQVLAKLDELVKARFIELFGDPATNPYGWQQLTVNDVCVSVVRGPFGSALKKEFFVPPSDTTYKVYEQKHAIQKSSTIGTYYVTAEKYNELRRFECHSGDILMSCSGTMGELYQLPAGCERGIINQALCKFTLNERILPIVFLAYMRETIGNLETKGSGIQNIAAVSYVKAMPINLPPMRVQEQYATFVEQTDKSKLAIQQSLDKLELLKKALMQKYFG